MLHKSLKRFHWPIQNLISTHQCVVQSQRLLQVPLRLIGRNEVCQQEGVVSGIGREEEIFIGLQLVYGLQHRQTELLLTRIQSGFAPGRGVLVVVGGEALLKGWRHEGQGEAQQKSSHGGSCLHCK